MEDKALRKSCQRVLRRLQQRRIDEFSCVLCSQRMRGQDALQEHFITQHHVHITHFDNIDDLSAMLSALDELVHPSDRQHISCPVCSTSCGSLHQFESHILDEVHGGWNESSVPLLAKFRIMAADGDDDDDESEQNDDAHYIADEEDDVLDDDEDWKELCVCLFCMEESDQCLQHMREVHHFDLVATTRSRKDVTDEYDVIRLVNAVRRCISQKRCPYHYLETSTNEDGCPHFDSVAALEEHLKTSPTHRLPAVVPQQDDYLLPFLPGDALLSLIVTSGEGFVSEEAEGGPDYPMVPTIFELVAQRKKEGAQSS